MPAAYAHKKFGIEVFHALSSDTKERIRRNLPYYLIGLHGPDILFFHYPENNGAIAAYASTLHHSSFREFYSRAKKILKYEASEEKFAYLCGVLCHLYLDAFCHPYVVWATESYGVTHGKLEMELERSLLEQDGCNPLTYPTTAHIGISREYARHIAPFYEGVREKEIYRCLWGYRLVSTATRRSDPFSRQAVCGVMSALGWQHKVASLVMSRQPSSLCRPAVRQLRCLFSSAVEPAKRAVDGLSESLAADDFPEYTEFTFYEKQGGSV